VSIKPLFRWGDITPFRRAAIWMARPHIAIRREWKQGDRQASPRARPGNLGSNKSQLFIHSDVLELLSVHHDANGLKGAFVNRSMDDQELRMTMIGDRLEIDRTREAQLQHAEGLLRCVFASDVSNHLPCQSYFCAEPFAARDIDKILPQIGT
jgi:hypothetical protein